MIPMKTRYLFLMGLAVLIAVAAVVLIASAGRNEMPRADKESAEKPLKAPPPEQESELPRLREDEIRDIVSVLQLWTVGKELELSEDQLMRIVPKYRQLTQMREDFWRGRRERVKQLSQATGQSGNPSTPADESKLREALQTFQRQEEQFWKTHSNLRQEILNELTVRQQVKYLLLESEAPRKIERMVRILKRMGEMRGQASPPPPPPEPGESRRQRAKEEQ